MRALLSRWLPAVATMAVIFWFSSQPVLPGPEDKLLDFLLKKLAHVLTYGVLALCYLRAVYPSRRPFLLALLLTVLYAAGDELHQSLVPLREATLRDVVIDSSAAAAAIWTARRILDTGRGMLLEVVQDAVGLDTGERSSSP